jgi:hypothetical protein
MIGLMIWIGRYWPAVFAALFWIGVLIGGVGR